MAVLARIRTPNDDRAPDSTPRRIVAEIPEGELEVVRFEQADSIAVPYFWLRGVDADPFESMLAADPRIAAVERLERSEKAVLFKAEWDVDSPLIHCLAAAQGKVQRAKGTSDEWRLTLWFESREQASTFQRCCGARGVALEVTQLRSLDDEGAGASVKITAEQREALVLAYREGYFDEPRGISQAALADQLGISSSAVAGRLRRGLSSLVGDTLVE